MILQQNKTQQFFVTVPAKICKAMGLQKGDDLKFKIVDKNKIMLSKKIKKKVAKWS